MAAVKGDRGACDKLCSVIVRSIGRCEYCDKSLPFGELDNSHFVGRTYSWTRTHLPNCVSSCRQCHTKHGNDPGLHARDFERIRAGMAESLTERRNWNKKFDWSAERLRLESIAMNLLGDPDLDPDCEDKIRQYVRKSQQKGNP